MFGQEIVGRSDGTCAKDSRGEVMMDQSTFAVVGAGRATVDNLRRKLANGETVDSLVASCFPILTKAQVYECLAYYEDHRGEIDLLVARQTTHDQR